VPIHIPNLASLFIGFQVTFAIDARQILLAACRLSSLGPIPTAGPAHPLNLVLALVGPSGGLEAPGRRRVGAVGGRGVDRPFWLERNRSVVAALIRALVAYYGHHPLMP